MLEIANKYMKIELTKEDKINKIVNFITKDQTDGGAPNSPKYKVIDHEKLAELLLELIENKTHENK